MVDVLHLDLSGRWKRHPLRGDARKPREELPGQGVGAALEEVVAHLVGRLARQRHVEHQETHLVPGIRNTISQSLRFIFSHSDGSIYTTLADPLGRKKCDPFA